MFGGPGLLEGIEVLKGRRAQDNVDAAEMHVDAVVNKNAKAMVLGVPFVRGSSDEKPICASACPTLNRLIPPRKPPNPKSLPIPSFPSQSFQQLLVISSAETGLLLLLAGIIYPNSTVTHISSCQAVRHATSSSFTVSQPDTTSRHPTYQATSQLIDPGAKRKETRLSDVHQHPPRARPKARPQSGSRSSRGENKLSIQQLHEATTTILADRARGPKYSL
ncbi:uncharacterized protein B0J16DRAFT_317949 [Fusarium flagelliforme]|uniref:uncharacterized protein n=1 Tax=Fusarium flagelliforme TaxID=2675880 RepID=UPI001E8D9EFB|nr:uncharacterized protein B0J16DRAFT_317949 [Fusarium flagelliforme]KAH7188280.1 hypothetical protein B0J16DRAFT_317949 [Fusarium flagelliforme]